MVFQKGHKLNVGRKSNRDRTGSKNSNWKQGLRMDKDGYVLRYAPNHPHAWQAKCVYDHRLVVEKQIGRYLKPEEAVHHLGAKDDNRPHMLMAFINAASHNRFEHGKEVGLDDIIYDGRKLEIIL